MTSVLRYRAEEDGSTGEVVPPKPHRLKPLSDEDNAERSSSGDGAANSEEAATQGTAPVPRPPDRPKSADLGAASPKTRRVNATAYSGDAPCLADNVEDMSGASTADTDTLLGSVSAPQSLSTKKAACRVSMDVGLLIQPNGSDDPSGTARNARSQSVHGTDWTMQAREGSERIQGRRSMVEDVHVPRNAREMVDSFYRKAEQKWLWRQMQGRTSRLESGCDLDILVESAEVEDQRGILEVDAAEVLDEVEGDEVEEAAPTIKIEKSKSKTIEEMNKVPTSRRQSMYILKPQEDVIKMDQAVAVSTGQPGGSDAVSPSTAMAQRAALKELLTAKKVDVDQIRSLLTTLPDVAGWLDSLLDPGPPLMPKPVVYAISMNDAPLVDLLLEYKADVLKPYDGPSMYKGFVKPGRSLVQSVVERKGRFVGTMLADKLTKIELLLLAAMAVQSARCPSKQVEDEAGEKEFELVEEVVEDGVSVQMDGEPIRRKSVAVKIAGGSTMRHTQGHPRDVFEISEHLGDGDRSSVWLGFHKETKAPVAIKTEQKLNLSHESWMWEEINLMRKVEHPNIAQLYETFECEKQIYMVLELCEGGRLFDNCTLEQCAAVMKSPKLMRQSAMAVDFLHGKFIAHRDIQLDNFLLVDSAQFPEGAVKLIDFTTAKKYGPDEPLKTKICTPGYVAKEILTRKMDPYTEKVDVWSLGVCFFIMLSGTPPFAGTDDMDTLKKVKKGVFRFEPEDRWAPVPDVARQLISGMINVKVEERLAAKDVLLHPYLANA